MKRPARGATEPKQLNKTPTLLHDGANEPIDSETRDTGVFGKARSAIKRPAAMNACRVPDPKQHKTGESRAVESQQTVWQDGTDESRAVEPHATDGPCSASKEKVSIHDLFLAAKASRAPCGRAKQTAKFAQLCEQVHNLGWFPREVKSTGAMAFDHDRKAEYNLLQSIKKWRTHMRGAQFQPS